MPIERRKRHAPRLFFLATVIAFLHAANVYRDIDVLAISSNHVVSVSDKTPCERLLTILGRDSERCNQDCMRISRSGRFSNNLLQILGAAQLAKLAGIKRVKIKSGFVWQTEPFDIFGVRFEPETDRKDRCVLGEYYYRVPDRPDLAFLNLTLPDEFKHRMKKMTNATRLPDGTGVFQVRSGDIFIPPKPMHLYGQPPCQYYTEVKNRGNWEKVILVTQNMRNPCAKYLIDRGAEWQEQNITSDMQVLLGAHSLAVGRGSLGLAVTMMSLHIERLYTFNASVARLNVPFQENCVPYDVYATDVLSYWKANGAQLSLLLTSKCQSWERIHYGDPSKMRVHYYDKLAV